MTFLFLVFFFVFFSNKEKREGRAEWEKKGKNLF